MTKFKDFTNGLLKPVIDVLSSILLYLVAQILTHNNIFTFDIRAFIILLGIISIAEDLGKGYFNGFDSPENAGYYILGIISGIIIFWGSLNATSIIIGGSITDVILSGILIILVMIAGIILRISISTVRESIS